MHDEKKDEMHDEKKDEMHDDEKFNVLEYKEIKKPPRKIPNRNNRGRTIFIKPAYKLLIVQFDKQSAYDYFMKENYWSLEIENFVVRILPGNPDDPEYKKCTSCYFKITGLPLNTTAKDIEPLIKHVYGRTCTFTQTTKHSTMKNAYIYISLDNYPVDAINGASSLFEEKITISENHRARYNHVITLNANKSSNTTSPNYKSSQPLARNYNNKNPQSGSLLYPRQNKQPYNHTNHGNNSKNYKYDNSYIAPHLDNPQMSTTKNSEHRITQLEQQVQSLLDSVKTLQEGKTKVDSTIADIHHNHNLMSSSLNDITTRLDKYDTIIQHLTTNINLLSQEKIAQSKDRSIKSPKRTSPYEQSLYRAAKTRYNLRAINKVTSQRKTVNSP
ncbi:hypothetical protein GLOIN_2v1843260 [Rhizophagus irregularis DAOM 181602=DAOM 197198]|nr:hypothetical protein GLOIN_2v1843260 [Rhizophagus irregularis DAOM 181602=DAOM 197198]